MNVLLSIKPKYVDEILAGKKIFEFRKAIFKKKDINKVFIYSSSPVKKIVASFEIARIIDDLPQKLWDKCHKYGRISKKDYFDYFKNSDIGYAIEIKNLKKFSEPIDPYLLKKDFRPPQSYCYLSLDYFENKIINSMPRKKNQNITPLESGDENITNSYSKQSLDNKRKKIKHIKDRNDELTNMPEGWKVVSFKDILEINPPKPSKDLVPSDTQVSFVPMSSVDADSGVITAPADQTFSKVIKGYTAFQNEDVIFAKITPCMENGKAAIARNLLNNLGFGSTEFIVLRSKGATVPDYIHYYIRQKYYRKLAESNMTGSVGQKRVPKIFISNSLIPFPPLPEQRAIVSKIEQLFSELDNGIANLKLAQEQLKVYRQAVLKKAFEGGFISGIISYKDVIINDIPSKIPSSWNVCKIGDYAKLQGGFAFKSKEYTPSGIPIVKIANVHYEKLDWTDKTFISEDRIEEFKDYSLDDGDILIAMTRPVIKSLNTVKTVIVSKNDLPALLNQRVGRFKTSNDLSKAYLKYFIYTDFFKKRIIKESSSTQQPNISSKKVENFDFIFPDNPELQQAIVTEIETRLSVCDKVEQDIEENLEKAEALRQSILKKAFEGKLLNDRELEEVRRAPDWEPAEVLLEKIRAEKTDSSKKGKT